MGNYNQTVRGATAIITSRPDDLGPMDANWDRNSPGFNVDNCIHACDSRAENGENCNGFILVRNNNGALPTCHHFITIGTPFYDPQVMATFLRKNSSYLLQTPEHSLTGFNTAASRRLPRPRTSTTTTTTSTNTSGSGTGTTGTGTTGTGTSGSGSNNTEESNDNENHDVPMASEGGPNMTLVYVLVPIALVIVIIGIIFLVYYFNKQPQPT